MSDAVPYILGLLSGPEYAATLRDFVARARFLPSDDAARKAGILDDMAAAPQHVMAAAYAGLGAHDGRFCQLEVPEQVHPTIERFLAIAALK